MPITCTAIDPADFPNKSNSENGVPVATPYPGLDTSLYLDADEYNRLVLEVIDSRACLLTLDTRVIALEADRSYFDTDNDTGIEVERTADDDTIYLVAQANDVSILTKDSTADATVNHATTSWHTERKFGNDVLTAGDVSWAVRAVNGSAAQKAIRSMTGTESGGNVTTSISDAIGGAANRAVTVSSAIDDSGDAAQWSLSLTGGALESGSLVMTATGGATNCTASLDGLFTSQRINATDASAFLVQDTQGVKTAGALRVNVSTGSVGARFENVAGAGLEVIGDTVRGFAGTGAGNGGNVVLTGGTAGATAGLGGGVNISTGGTSFGGATTGSVNVFTANPGGANSSSGAIGLFTGDATGTGKSGDLSFYVGNVATGNLGGIALGATGSAPTAPAAGAIELTADSEVATSTSGHATSGYLADESLGNDAIVAGETGWFARTRTDLAAQVGRRSLFATESGTDILSYFFDTASASSNRSVTVSGTADDAGGTAQWSSAVVGAALDTASILLSGNATDATFDADATTFDFTAEAAGSTPGFLFTADSIAAGPGVRISSNSANTSSRSVVEIIQDHASATNAKTLTLRNDLSAGVGLALHNGTADQMFLDVDATIRSATNVDLKLEAVGATDDIIFDARGMTTPITLNDATNKDLDAGFTSSSVVGCFNELITSYAISGTWTPTFTNVSNVTSFDATNQHTYLRIGDQVTITGAVTLTPSTTGLIRFRFSLASAISATFAAATEVDGCATSTGTNWDQGGMVANTTNNQPQCDFRISGSASQLTMNYTCKFTAD